MVLPSIAILISCSAYLVFPLSRKRIASLIRVAVRLPPVAYG